MTQRYLWGAMVLVAAMLIGVPAIWAGDLASIELQAAGQQCEATPMLVAAADGESQPGGEGAVGSGDVQERAVPRLTPGMPGMASFSGVSDQPTMPMMSLSFMIRRS